MKKTKDLYRSFKEYAASLSLGTALAITPVLAQSQNEVATPIAQKVNASSNYAFDDAMKVSSQYVIMGDPDHSVIDAAKFMASEATMDTFKQAGFKHIFIERPTELQPLVTALVNGDLSKEAFAHQMETQFVVNFTNPQDTHQLHLMTADIILNAKKNGIETHFMDSDDSENALLTPKDPKLEEFNKRVIEVLNNKIAKLDPGTIDKMTNQENFQFGIDTAVEYYNSLPQSEQDSLARLFAKNLQTIMDRRFSYDGVLADTIRTIAGNDKSVIFYGVYHSDGLEKGLGKDKLTTFVLTTSVTENPEWNKKGWHTLILKTDPTLPTPTHLSNIGLRLSLP